ncbi:MAG: hypothetical protein AUJ12_03580 [Alphaproteobacteria bacterium CG1_02_46_17]|nr:MAG: hypothetical protein AUJ12_03580 [Alphaproteobacteria bacterium CG1_02_46_17]
MNNPMTYDWVRAAYNNYPDNIQDFLNRVNQFAYDAPHHIESRLGEYSRSNFDKQKLVDAVTASIRSKDVLDRWSPYKTLTYDFAKANLPDAALEKVQRITEEVALARIAQAIYTDANGKELFHEHGHHGRQYIARDVVARVIREVLPQPTLLERAAK